MSADRIVPALLIGVLLAFAALIPLGENKNQTFNGVIVMNFNTYEFYPNAKDCNYRGTPYVVLPNAPFREIVASGNTDIAV
jgi:hypothetical protein